MKDLIGAPSNTLKKFRKMAYFNFFYIFMKNAFATNSRFFHNMMQVIKKKEMFDRKVFKLQHFSKGLPNVG